MTFVASRIGPGSARRSSWVRPVSHTTSKLRRFAMGGVGLGIVAILVAFVGEDGLRALRSVDPLPLSLAPAYASLPKRNTGLSVPYSPDQRARIEYRLRAGATLLGFEHKPPPSGLRGDSDAG